MTIESVAKKDIQKLQRAIVDGLEDVKAQDIQVFNTEHLSPLFERVIVASGTSNRQTKALAASVRDAVREAGFPKPRIEGEDNGEWIIVDCGQAVAHVMQPAIRQYYHLEEIWGEKPVRLRLGAAKPTASRAAVVSAQTRTRDAQAREAREQSQGPSLKRSSAAKTATRAAEREAQAASKPGRARKAGSASASSKSKSGARTAPKAAPNAAPKAAPKTASKSAPQSAPKTGASAPKAATPRAAKASPGRTVTARQGAAAAGRKPSAGQTTAKKAPRKPSAA